MKRERGRYIAPVLMLLLLCSRETGRSGGATASPLMVMSVTGRRGASAAAATLFLPLVISTIFSPNPFSYFFFLFGLYPLRTRSLSLSRGVMLLLFQWETVALPLEYAHSSLSRRHDGTASAVFLPFTD